MSVARILFAGFFGIFSTSTNKILLDAQKSEHNKKLSTKPNTYDTLQDHTKKTHTAPPHLHSLHKNHPLSLVPESYRNTLSTAERTIHTSNLKCSPISHITFQQATIDDTHAQNVEQPYTLNFRSQNKQLFSPR